MSKNKTGETNHAKFIFTGIIAIIVLIVLLNCISTVKAGHTGVLVEFGKVHERQINSGLVFHAPWQSIQQVNNQVQSYEVETSAASRDLQTVISTVQINYSLLKSDSARIYRDIGLDIDVKILQPALQDCVKQATARHRAADLVVNRQLVAEEMRESLQSKMNEFGIQLEAFNITNFTFSPEFTAAIERTNTLEQEVLAERQDLEKARVAIERDIAVAEGEALEAEAKAKGEAAAMIARAEAQAEAVRLEAIAEAEAIALIQAQIASNPEYLEYLRIQAWDGKNVSTVLGESVGIFVGP